ncbi:MAG: alpha/beta hydrolase [Chloroflexaceae bacterium]|nr:alpha/beta hydrolase [Chloroflexaceae bacterium]
MLQNAPDFILLAQHGWADNNRTLDILAKRLATPKTCLVTPNLGYVQTWIRIEPLIQAVEKVAAETIALYPEIPLRIIGHSMGGLICLEVLHRHPEWHSLVHSLVLIGSPLGGASLARIIDPLNLGIGISSDLSRSRKAIAQEIAAVIPTLAIAGNLDGGGDGMINLGSTRVRNCHFRCLPGIAHPALRNHPRVEAAIREFWLAPTVPETTELTKTDKIIHYLESIPGMTDAHQKDFSKAKPLFTLNDGSTILFWRNPWGVAHVFLASPRGDYLWGGFVGWLHLSALDKALQEIQQEYSLKK